MAAASLISVESHKPFDLERGQLFRANLVRFDDTDHLLILVVEKIVADRWSFGILLHELSILYKAFLSQRDPRLPAPLMQYPAFAAWQRKWLRDQKLSTLLGFWQRELAGMSPFPRLDLPLDTDRTNSPEGVQSVHLSDELAMGLRQLCGRLNVPLLAPLLAAVAYVISRYSQSPDVAVLSPFAKRTARSLRTAVGWFEDLLVLRIDSSGARNAEELIGRSILTLGKASEHEQLPFSLLQKAIFPEAYGHRPTIPYLFVDVVRANQGLYLDTLRVETAPCPSGPKGYPGIDLIAQSDGVANVSLKCWYESDRYGPELIKVLLQDLVAALERIQRSD